MITFDDVLAGWDAAPRDAIHPSRAISEDAYWTSGEVSAEEIAAVIPEGASVVDFGCGDGRVAIPLRALGVDVIGVDASPTRLQALRERDPDLSTLLSDGSDLADQLLAKVDVVICLAVLIHHDYESCVRILRDLRRATRRGGLMLLHWPVLDEAPYERKTWTEITYWTAAEQARVAKEVGLRPARIENVSLPWSSWRTV